jgi:hypothetical protein
LGVALESVRITPLDNLAELLLPVMAEGWVAQVVSERCSLDHIRVQAAPSICYLFAIHEETFCKATADLRNLQRMCQAVVEHIPLTSSRHLGYPAQSTELRGVQDPVAIPLIRTARIGAIGLQEPIRPAAHYETRRIPSRA